MTNKKPELLAPANIKTLTCAVQAGADAVYLGGAGFGARKNAGNFDNEELAAAVEYCHLRGVKVHMTLNTLVSDKELDSFCELAKFAAKTGVDAFIVQDLGAFEALKTVTPDMELHASTQLTVHNTDSAITAEKMGFDRIVLSREMSAEDIAATAAAIGIETEIFVHGALCVCYSGQCLMSSFIGGRSGNRGLCAQPCRLPYTLEMKDKKLGSGYLLSPKDLCLAGDMEKILGLGVASLKIEGRMKGPEYVAAVTSVYRKCIDEFRNADADEIYLLKNSFCRGGFTKGYFEKTEFRNMVCADKNHDDIYENRDSAALEQISEYTLKSCNLKRNKLTAEVRAFKNYPLELDINFGTISVHELGEVVQTAQNKPTDKETIIRQINKTGNVPFEFEKIEVNAQNDIFLPLSAVNNIRKKAIESLEGLMLERTSCEIGRLKPPDRKPVHRERYICAAVRNEIQLSALEKGEYRYIFVPCRLFGKVKHFDNFVYKFPDITENKNLAHYYELLRDVKKIGGMIITGNFALIEQAKVLEIECIGSRSLNIFNSLNADFWQSRGMKIMQVSGEMTLPQLRDIAKTAEIIVVAYGKETLMKTKYCAVCGQTGSCDKKSCGTFSLTDRKGERFEMIKQGDCITEIINSRPTYMADKQADFEKFGVSGICLEFTTETAEECKKIINSFKNAEPPQGEFTRGHFYNGVI